LVPSFNQTITGQCFNSPSTYWDLGLRGDTGPTDHSSGVTFDPKASVITSIADYPGAGAGFGANSASFTPGVAAQYCNGSKRPPEAHCTDANTGATIPCGYSVPPGTNETNVPNPIFSLTAGATVDEGNNWVSISWGPLAMTNPQTNAQLGDYGLAAGSPAINYVTTGNSSTTYTAAPANDFFGTPRKTNNAVDAGAVEFVAVANTPVLRVSAGSLNFGNVVTGTTSGSQTLTLSNTGTGGATSILVSVATTSTPTTPNQFARAGGTCGATLAAGASCTITVTFSPTSVGSKTGTVTITASVTVAGSPVVLSGTGSAAVLSAALTPTSRNFGNATRGVGALSAPTQVFVLTNTGNAPLTGIGQAALGGSNPTEFSIVRALSTCGPTGNGQLVSQTTLAPGAACVFTVQFRPLTNQTTGAKSATVSVTDVAGTQTSTLTGTAQ